MWPSSLNQFRISWSLSLPTEYNYKYHCSQYQINAHVNYFEFGTETYFQDEQSQMKYRPLLRCRYFWQLQGLFVDQQWHQGWRHLQNYPFGPQRPVLKMSRIFHLFLITRKYNLCQQCIWYISTCWAFMAAEGPLATSAPCFFLKCATTTSIRWALTWSVWFFSSNFFISNALKYIPLPPSKNPI